MISLWESSRVFYLINFRRSAKHFLSEVNFEEIMLIVIIAECILIKRKLPSVKIMFRKRIFLTINIFFSDTEVNIV